MPQYLSTDPNAGQPQEKRYLSTDPNAGTVSNAPAPDKPPPIAGESFMSTFGPAVRTAAEAMPVIGLPLRAMLNPDEAPSLGGAVGGTVGALGGPVGAVAGAAAGGAGGEFFRRGVKGEPLDEVTGYATEAAKQGALELGGRAVAGALKAGGKGLYNLATGPSKALKKDFGDVSEAAIEAGAFMPGSKRFGTDKVTAAREASAAEARGMLADKLPPGARVKVDVPLKNLDDLRARVKANPRAIKDLAAIDEFEADVRAGHQGGFTADELLDFKQAGQAKASQHYRAAERGDIAGQMDADANAAVAGGAQKFLERLAPETAGANARTKGLIGAERAMEDAAARSNLMRYLLTVPSAGASLLTIPQVGGPIGFAANKTGKALGRGVAPNMARVLEMLLSGQGEP